LKMGEKPGEMESQQHAYFPMLSKPAPSNA
jgi:hypothetical protein